MLLTTNIPLAKENFRNTGIIGKTTDASGNNLQVNNNSHE